MAKTLKLTHSVKSLPERIFDVLADFRKFGSYHPYISEVSDPEQNSNGAQVFRVKEKLRLLGVVPCTTSYPVRVIPSRDENKVVYESTLFMHSSLKIEFRLIETPGSERVTVEETITFSAPPLSSIPVFSMMKSAHNTLFLEMSASLKSDFYGINKLK